MEGFTPLSNSINLAALTGSEFKISFALTRYCFGNKNTCFPSQKRLAQEAGICVRTVQRCLKKLAQKNMIIIKHRIGTTNIYTILNKIKLQVQQQKSKFNEYVKNAYRKNYGRASNERQYDAAELEKALLERHSNHPE